MAAFSRRHYELIAKAIREEKAILEERENPEAEPRYEIVANMVLDALAYRLASKLQADNPRFDRVRFLLAAGVPVESRHSPVTGLLEYRAAPTAGFRTGDGRSFRSLVAATDHAKLVYHETGAVISVEKGGS